MYKCGGDDDSRTEEFGTKETPLRHSCTRVSLREDGKTCPWLLSVAQLLAGISRTYQVAIRSVSQKLQISSIRSCHRICFRSRTEESPVRRALSLWSWYLVRLRRLIASTRGVRLLPSGPSWVSCECTGVPKVVQNGLRFPSSVTVAGMSKEEIGPVKCVFSLSLKKKR